MSVPDYSRLQELMEMCRTASKGEIPILAREIQSLRDWTEQRIAAIRRLKGNKELRVTLSQLRAEVERIQKVIAGYPQCEIELTLSMRMAGVIGAFRSVEIAPMIDAGRGSLLGSANGRRARAKAKAAKIAALQKFFDQERRKDLATKRRDFIWSAICKYAADGGTIPEKTIRDYIREGKINIK